MWLFTPDGFYSVVNKDPSGENRLCIRSRVAADLDKLRAKYIPSLSPTEESTYADYQYRGYAPRQDVARAMMRVVEDIDYDNFKDRVAVNDKDRSHVYSRVWADVLQLDKREWWTSYAESETGRTETTPTWVRDGCDDVGYEAVETAADVEPYKALVLSIANMEWKRDDETMDQVYARIINDLEIEAEIDFGDDLDTEAVKTVIAWSEPVLLRNA